MPLKEWLKRKACAAAELLASMADSSGEYADALFASPRVLPSLVRVLARQ